MKLHFKTFTYVLSDKIQQLYTLCHDLLYLGMDGSPVYTNDLSRLNRDVYRLCDELYDSGLRGATPEEEGFLCLSLLKGYLASYCDYGNKQTRIQAVLQRIRARARVAHAHVLEGDAAARLVGERQRAVLLCGPDVEHRADAVAAGPGLGDGNNQIGHLNEFHQDLRHIVDQRYHLPLA